MSIDDWAARAARRIIEVNSPRVSEQRREERFAAIIAIFAAPIVGLLRESRREHEHLTMGEYGHECCPRCDCESWGAENEPNSDEPCNCGADDWNKRIDKALR